MKHDFCIFIFSYGRPEFLLKNTYKNLVLANSKAKTYIVLSSDDKTIPQYKEMFENVIVFDKDDIKQDTCDAYQSIRSCVFFARNKAFELAESLGYRYFLTLDDDYNYIAIRYRDGNHLFSYRIQQGFDEICDAYFDILDSQPFMKSVAFSQDGDYVGGYTGGLYKDGYRFKAMNCFFCDTHKKFDFIGRINEDVNTYISNNLKGNIFLTFSGTSVAQANTQQVSNGMTESYKFGTYLKSYYTIVVAPSVASIKLFGNSYPRIHHSIKWANTVPKIIDDKYKSDYNDIAIEPNDVDVVRELENSLFVNDEW